MLQHYNIASLKLYLLDPETLKHYRGTLHISLLHVRGLDFETVAPYTPQS